MFANLKLKFKMLLMAIIPVLVLCIAALIINETVIREKMIADVKNQLNAAAESVAAAYNQNTGDYFENWAGEVWKGSYNLTKSEALLDDIAENAGIDVTFFYGSRRLVTSLTGANGDRLLDSPAGDYVVEHVLNNGENLFTSGVSVEGQMYYGYYIPIYQNNSDEIVGMVFAGMPVAIVENSINSITLIFAVVLLIILAVVAIICNMVASGLSKNIKQSIDVVEGLAAGNLNVAIDERQLKRKDEIGSLVEATKNLVDSLGSIIGAITDNTISLNATSQEMNSTANHANASMDDIHNNLKSLLDGAAIQSNSAQNVRNNISNINQMLSETAQEVNKLSESAEQMKESGDEVENSLHVLNDTNNEVLKAIEQIQTKTKQTNDSVVRIREAVTFISEIAEETNLLSLNASIEAARAGEAGKGFAVVAQQISKLAEQSNDASASISDIVDILITNSNKTVETMDMVQNAINEQSKSVKSTAKIFSIVRDNIVSVAGGVDNIRTATESLGHETASIENDIAALGDIANNNEKTVEQAVNSGNEVMSIVANVNDMSAEVKSSASGMSDVVAKFMF